MSGYAAKQIELSSSYTTSQVIVTRKPVLRRSATSAEARTRDRSANCSRDSSAARSTYQFSYVGRKPSVSTLRQKSPPRTTTPVPCKLSRMSCASPVKNAVSWMCRPREIPLFRTSGGTNAIHCSPSVWLELSMVYHSLVIDNPMEHAFVVSVSARNPNMCVDTTVTPHLGRDVTGGCETLYRLRERVPFPWTL